MTMMLPPLLPSRRNATVDKRLEDAATIAVTEAQQILATNFSNSTSMNAGSDEELELILAEFIKSVENGEQIDRESFIAKYPDHQDDLKEFFDDWDSFGGPTHLAPSQAINEQPLQKVVYFGDYELVEEIAQGGMGIVYKARQTSLNRIVAVKMILKGQFATDSDLQRFRAEAEAAGSLHHPNIVSVHEVGAHEGLNYFSMDYVEGESLSDVIRRDRPTPQQAAEYVKVIAEAIHYAHLQGTLHRDLKPSNILIDQNNQIRITDFGLAKRVHDDRSITKTGDIVGSPGYMAPEQAAGKHQLLGPASDVYSMGVILYELLTGQPPFKANSPVDLIRMVIEADPQWPRTLNSKVPRDLEVICQKCMSKEPSHRYATADELADDLKRFLADEPIKARPLSQVGYLLRWCRRRPKEAALSGTLALTIIIALGVVTFLWRTADDNFKTAVAAQKAEQEQRHNLEQEKQRSEELRERAEENFKHAREAVDRLLHEVSTDEALMKAVPGAQSVRKALLENASQYYERFLEDLNELNQDDDQKDSINRELQASLANSFLELAAIARVTGEKEKAAKSLEAAFNANSLLAKSDSAEISQKAKYSIARIYHQQGLIHEYDNKPQEAIERYEKARASFEAMPAGLPRAIDLSGVLINLGRTYMKTGRKQEGAKTLREAVNVTMEHFEEHKENSKLIGNLIAAHVNIGTILNQAGKPMEAKEEFLAAARAGDPLIKTKGLFHSGIVESVAVCQLNLGQIYIAEGKEKQARDIILQSRLHFRRLSIDNPSVIKLRMNVALANAVLTRVTPDVDGSRMRITLLDDAINIMEYIYREAPQRGDVQYHLKEMYLDRSRAFQHARDLRSAVRDTMAAGKLLNTLGGQPNSPAKAQFDRGLVWLNAAILARTNKQQQDAVESVDQAILALNALSKRNKSPIVLVKAADAHLVRAQLHQDANDMKLAKQSAERAKALYPKDVKDANLKDGMENSLRIMAKILEAES